MYLHDPWDGADTPGYAEAVLAGQDLEKQAPEGKTEISKIQKTNEWISYSSSFFEMGGGALLSA